MIKEKTIRYYHFQGYLEKEIKIKYICEKCKYDKLKRNYKYCPICGKETKNIIERIIQRHD